MNTFHCFNPPKQHRGVLKKITAGTKRKHFCRLFLGSDSAGQDAALLVRVAMKPSWHQRMGFEQMSHVAVLPRLWWWWAGIKKYNKKKIDCFFWFQRKKSSTVKPSMKVCRAQ